MGIPKKGRYGGCLGAHITKSVVVVYRIDYAAHRIDMIKMGDHKASTGETARRTAEGTERHLDGRRRAPGHFADIAQSASGRMPGRPTGARTPAPPAAGRPAGPPLAYCPMPKKAAEDGRAGRLPARPAIPAGRGRQGRGACPGGAIRARKRAFARSRAARPDLPLGSATVKTGLRLGRRVCRLAAAAMYAEQVAPRGRRAGIKAARPPLPDAHSRRQRGKGGRPLPRPWRAERAATAGLRLILAGSRVWYGAICERRTGRPARGRRHGRAGGSSRTGRGSG